MRPLETGRLGRTTGYSYLRSTVTTGIQQTNCHYLPKQLVLFILRSKINFINY